MSVRRTPPLSLKGSREVLEEMSRPPEDTPERRRMFEIAKRRRPVEGQPDRWEYHPGAEDAFAPGALVARKLTEGDLQHEVTASTTGNIPDARGGEPAPAGDLLREDPAGSST